MSNTFWIIAGSILGGLEIILRAIPTKQNNSPIAIVLRVLTAISDFLNNKKATPAP